MYITNCHLTTGKNFTDHFKSTSHNGGISADLISSGEDCLSLRGDIIWHVFTPFGYNNIDINQEQKA